jgi:hypothetical protein
MHNKPDSAAWYRHPWVWVLVAIPLSAVIGGIITLNLAIRSDDGLVEDDYYKRGKEINRVLERDHAARRHGLESILEFDYDNNTVRVRLLAAEHFQPPEQVQLKLLHPTRAGHDAAIILNRRNGSDYLGTIPELMPGRWYLHLEADDWRLTGTLQVPEFAMAHIVPSPDASN